MIVLGIDSSTMQLGIGLADANGVMVDRLEASSREHASQIIGEIERALSQGKVDKEQLSGIGIAIGPGSFTGLRIGLSVAKGMSTALNIPLVGVSTYQVIAARLGKSLECFYLAGRSRRGEYYLSRVKAGQISYGLCEESGLHEIIGDLPVGLVGGGDDDLAVFESSKLTLIESKQIPISGGELAAMAAERISEGKTDDISSLEPLYVAPSQAERKFGQA